MANWLSKLTSDALAPDGALEKLRDSLGDLYIASDSEIRRCIVDAVLEHAFENPRIRGLFDTWKNKDQLGLAYLEAAEWEKHGGKTA